MSTLSERERESAQAEAISAVMQAERKQNELVLANMKRLRSLRTNYATATHEPDRLNT